VSEGRALNEFHVKNVCKFGKKEETCSFLAMGGEGLMCTKGTSLEFIIQQRREQKSMRAMGDNCSGPPDFTVPA